MVTLGRCLQYGPSGRPWIFAVLGDAPGMPQMWQIIALVPDLSYKGCSELILIQDTFAYVPMIPFGGGSLVLDVSMEGTLPGILALFRMAGFDDRDLHHTYHVKMEFGEGPVCRPDPNLEELLATMKSKREAHDLLSRQLEYEYETCPFGEPREI